MLGHTLDQLAAGAENPFAYERIFERNNGWLNIFEQEKLRRACVAIAGLGGAGGYQAEALARLGVGNFKLADFDVFEPSNMNRQLGATSETIGSFKTHVMRDRILSINPEANVEIFSDGFTFENAERFMEDVDTVIDGIEFFEHAAKLLLFQTAYKKKIPAITSCPLGFGVSLMVFSPDGMRYEDYFDLRSEMTEREARNKISFGLSPSPFCLKYMDRSALNFDSKRAASVIPGLMMVGALTATETVRILTGKGKIHWAPWIFQVDLLTYQTRHKYYRWGMRGPWMRFKRWLTMEVALRFLKSKSS